MRKQNNVTVATLLSLAWDNMHFRKVVTINHVTQVHNLGLTKPFVLQLRLLRKSSARGNGPVQFLGYLGVHDEHVQWWARWSHTTMSILSTNAVRLLFNRYACAVCDAYSDEKKKHRGRNVWEKLRNNQDSTAFWKCYPNSNALAAPICATFPECLLATLLKLSKHCRCCFINMAMHATSGFSNWLPL